MCKFFSFLSDGKGNFYYLNHKQREDIRNDVSVDSHSYIASYFRINEDRFNKYEYNPITQVLVEDSIIIKEDLRDVHRFLRELDFKTIVKELNIKNIVNPLFDIRTIIINSKLKKLFNIYITKYYSIKDPVRGSVRDSVWGSVRDSVRDSVWGSVRDSVWDSVGGSVWGSVWGSAGGSVGDSVWDSVSMYSASFFNAKYKDKLSELITINNKLWDLGCVISYDGTYFRLHGYKGKILKRGVVKI